MTQTIDLDLDQVVIHTIRTLAMDAVQAANQDFAGTEEGTGERRRLRWRPASVPC
jgi:hypothetical protein